MNNFASDIIKLNKVIHPDLIFSHNSIIFLNKLFIKTLVNMIKQINPQNILQDLKKIFGNDLYNQFLKNYNIWIQNIVIDVNKIKYFCKNKEFKLYEIKLLSCIIEYLFVEIMEISGLYALKNRKNTYTTHSILISITKDKEINDLFKLFIINYDIIYLNL